MTHGHELKGGTTFQSTSVKLFAHQCTEIPFVKVTAIFHHGENSGQFLVLNLEILSSIFMSTPFLYDLMSSVTFHTAFAHDCHVYTSRFNLELTYLLFSTTPYRCVDGSPKSICLKQNSQF